MSQWKSFLIATVAVALSLAAPGAHAQEPGRVVVLQARLGANADPAKDVPVNLLIENGELQVVTEDNLVVEHGDVAVDATGGFLLGKLVLGASPNIVILDRDPREDFEVLLDTGDHVLFAMRNGIVVRNILPAVPESPEGEHAKRRGWKAYAPPPMAVPIRYYDSRKWNKFTSKAISGLFTGALMLDRQYWLDQDSESEAQVGDLSGFDGGKIRALRVGVVGTLNFPRPWVYTLFVASNAFEKDYSNSNRDALVFFDYRFDIPLAANLTVSFGKMKEPISMERLTTLAFLPMQERSAVADALLPSRNHGVVLSGNPGGGWWTWAVGGFNDWIDEHRSFSDTSSQVVGRTTWVPFVSEDESNLLHLGLGVRVSDAKQPLSTGTEPEFKSSPDFVATGSIPADDMLTYNLETYWRKGPYLVGFEYLGTSIKSSGTGNSFVQGYQIGGSWAMTGEMRAYRRRSGIFDPLPVSSPVNQGGWGTFETAVRFSRLDLTDGVVDGGSMDIFSLGANWWPTRFAQLSANYRFVQLDRFDAQGESSGLNVRLVMILD